MPDRRPSILLIDDRVEFLQSLETKLAEALASVEVEIRTWVPSDEGVALFDKFNGLVDDRTVLVVTDYDLTTKVKGFFGLSVVGWSQQRSIAAGDFSRGHKHMLPKEPNLFELRVPPDDAAAAAFIANAFVGFEQIRNGIKANYGEFEARSSLGSVLSTLLGRKHLESQFAAYMSRLGSANAALVQQITVEGKTDEASDPPDNEEKIRLMTYVLGHVMLNSILKYPGPILASRALCAYVATSEAEADAVGGMFVDANYEGPFAGGDRYFWRETVDEILDRESADLAGVEFADFGDYNRAVVERHLTRELRPHDECQRSGCGGKKGGFWCPFTLRPVCVRTDCSVPSSSWIPDGAQLSRVERDFYEEWAPLLGL